MATTPTNLPVPSESARDLKFNAGKIDEFVTSLAYQYIDRFGKQHHTIEGLKAIITQAIYNLGFNPVGSFQSGGTVTAANDILQDTSSLSWYRWDDVSTLPKVVPSGSTPGSSGGTGPGKWQLVDVSDVLRRELNGNGGASKVRAEDGRTVQQWLVAVGSAEYRAKNIAKRAWVDYQVHNRGSIKALFQGDSITAGYDRTSTDVIPPQDGDWATRASMNYPYRFATYLNEQSGCNVSVTMRAYSGYTAKEAYIREDWTVNPNCDVVMLMYGINDVAGVQGATLDTYMEYMEKLIRRFIDWGMAVVVMLPAGGGQGAGNPLWLQWGKRMRMMASIYGCATFNGHEANLHRHFSAIQSDAVHFNSMGYSILGEKLASMFMAGGLVETYRPVTNETTVWPGMLSDQIGWCAATSNIFTDRADGAYTRDKITGLMPQGEYAAQTFSFYLDAEAAHLYGKVSGPVKMIYSSGTWWNNNAQPYYQYAADQNMSYSGSNERAVAQPKAGNGGVTTGANQFIGRVVGRGWHTITFFTNQDGSTTDPAYVQAVTVQPIPVGLSVEQMWKSEEKRYRVVNCTKIPSPANAGDALTAAVQLSGFSIKAPQSLAGTGKGNLAFPTPYYYNTLPMRLRIMDEKGNVFEGNVYKTGPNDSTWSVKTLINTFSETNKPSASAVAGTVKRHLKVAANSVGPGMPQENIYDFDGPVVPLGSDGASTFLGGVYLIFTLSWPQGAPAGYWNIELEGSDWFGNSETSFGSY
ncbi:SGNH/GDSL hydrolase family protein [Kosakonia cowanii]|jgi:lysophospholipase L1-like esterase|uniref:SGNH/GDSL hydrolase family protein n=1 Tax=Kosakonia cowanii TaxID=208223 RepID=UPI001F586FB8|nr:SGNH/GDSL hydrolase family protein [Kosakonia cowanii]